MKRKWTILISILVFISCSVENDLTNSGLVESFLKQEIHIQSGDVLKINLGNFGDEEGARIFVNPQNAKVSKLYRELSAGSMFYEYSPLDDFSGKDIVGFIINRGSDGASLGISDSIRICIITE